MKYASVCSGVEAASLAFETLGWEPAWFSEIDAFPSAVLSYRYPNVPNLGDMTKIKCLDNQKGIFQYGTDGVIHEFGRIDLLVGGTPCFVADTMVLTPKGYVPIQNISVGDEVISHNGKVCKVSAVGNKKANVGEVKILSRPTITCTGNHPFLTAKVGINHIRSSNTYGNNILKGNYEFTAIEKSVNRFAAHLTNASISDVKIPLIYNAKEIDVIELAGWYVGDGYIRRFKGKTKKTVCLALVNTDKIQKFRERFSGIINFCESNDGKIHISCTALADWLSNEFGEGSLLKHIPYWLYSHAHKESFMHGYETTDGCFYKNAYQFTTVSRALAYGIADLCKTSTVVKHEPNPTTVIEGRTVAQHTQYVLRNNQNSYTRKYGEYYASKIKSWRKLCSTRTVYNLTVEGEHTYVVEGFVVHNCQSFSTAGTRTGLQGVSGLALTYCELLKSMRPTWFLWENVPGCLSSNNGEDFKTILKAFDEIGYSCAWRVLDAQYCRVDGFPRAIPQRRRRVFVVGHSSGDWRYPAEVLFEPSCLPRTTPPCRVKGKGYREGIEGSIGTTGESVKGTLLSVHGAQTPITSEGFAHPLGARNLGLENCLYESRCLAATDHKNNLAVRVVGVDVYNQVETGNVACSVTTATGVANTTGPKVMSLYEEQE